MMFKETSFAQVLRSIVATLLAVAGCAVGGRPSSGQISYHIAVIEGDSLGVEADKCDVHAAESLTYRYPSGSTVTVRASQDPLLAIPLDESVNIQLLDFTGATLPEVRVVIAEVIPTEPTLERAAAVRRSFLRCDLLIMLDGKAVGIERPGRNWSQRLPGGRFSSMQAAAGAFSKSGASVRSEVPVAELKAQEDFWEWRRQQDLWDFHCDSTLRETIRAKDPNLYEALKQTGTPDCQSPPKLPEEGNSTEEE